MSRVPLLMLLGIALSASGCLSDDGGNGDGDASDALRDAIAKTEAAKTARMDFTMSVSGAARERYRARWSWTSSMTATT